jgi:hypothetical protein
LRFPNNIEKIHKYIIDEMTNSHEVQRDLFNVQVEDTQLNTEVIMRSKIIPVIYQPAIDTLRSFIREIHCCKIKPDTIEVSLIFETEQLSRKPIGSMNYLDSFFMVEI